MRNLGEDNFLERLASLRAKRGCPNSDSLAALVDGGAASGQSEAFENHKKACSICRELEQRLRRFERAEAEADNCWLKVKDSVRGAIASRIREESANLMRRSVAAEPISTKWWRRPIVWMPAGLAAAGLLVFVGFDLFTFIDNPETRPSETSAKPQAKTPRTTGGPDIAAVLRNNTNSKAEIEQLRSASKETGTLPESIRLDLNTSILIRITAKTPQSDESFSFDATVLESDSSSNIPVGTQLSGLANETPGRVEFSISEMRHHQVRYANRDTKRVTAAAAASDDDITYRLVVLVPSSFERSR